MTNLLMRNKANESQSRIPQIKKPRSIFPVGMSRKQTMKCGYLYPIFCQEVLPGDTWDIDMSALLRLATQITSPLDNLVVNTYFFFDPDRLKWENFTKQHGERENPNDTIDYITPAIEFPEGIPFKSLWDYFGGVRCGIPNSKVTVMNARMYNRIVNRYFRAEHLQDSLPEHKGDANDPIEDYKIVKKAKMHDYFTDCLPNLQLGEAVTIPLVSGTVPVVGNGMSLGLMGSDGISNETGYKGGLSNININPERILAINSDAYGKGSGWAINPNVSAPADNTTIGVTTDPTKSGLVAAFDNIKSATIAAMRLAIDTQEILEADNRNGVRFTTMLEHRYGALNPDLRLDRPQYLGGTSTPLFTTPVIQTSGSGTTGQNTPQGNIAGFGIAQERNNVIKMSFGEFGTVMGLCCIQAVPQYQQGMHKKHQRWERFDYMYPEFQGLSDQAVTNGEIYYQGGNVVDENGTPIDQKPFGYIPRYDDYRFFINEICGELRSEYPQSLDVWHYAEKFENLPELSGQFIEDKTDEIVKRTLAIQTVDNNGEEVNAEQILCEFKFTGSVTRVLTSKAIPTTGGRIL